MAKLILEGLTVEQAKVLAEWFEEDGEQQCHVWFAALGVKSPVTNMKRDGGCFETIGDDTIVHCHTPRR